VLSLLATSSVVSAATPRYAVLPESTLSKTLNQCSRSTPQASAAWTPSTEQLRELEDHLPQLAELAARQGLPRHIGDPASSFRQYLGVVVDGHRYIYINAMPASEVALSHVTASSTKPAMVCDGGNSFWGALYDPDTKAFSQLSANGVA